MRTLCGLGNTAHSVVTSVDCSISSPWGSGVLERAYVRSVGSSNESVNFSNNASASNVPALSRARCRS